MLSFGNKEFRNLQEQVLKNAQDIEVLKGRENLQVVIVEELPEVGNPNYIYLVPNEGSEEANVYNEYIWLTADETYEKIGGVSIDLTNYMTLNTEQNVTGVKSFTNGVIINDVIKISASNNHNVLDFYLSADLLFSFSRYNFTIGSGLDIDLGGSSRRFKDIYLKGKVDLGNNATITRDSSDRINFNVGGDTIIKVGSTSYIKASWVPEGTSTYDLGSASNYWKNLYLTGNISDGANTVSVANIASKVTSSYASGTFDTNGEDTIDISGGTPEGLFIFACGNCQTMLHLTATMVQNAELTPIVVPCYYIETGTPQQGQLKISKSGTTLTLFLGASPLSHVDSGYAWTLTKTNLL